MAIVEKPKKTKLDAETLINKGGSVPAAQVVAADEEVMNVQLRVPKQLVTHIDRLRAARKIKIPRHTWLLEAIHEKIEREQRKAGTSG